MLYRSNNTGHSLTIPKPHHTMNDAMVHRQMIKQNDLDASTEVWCFPVIFERILRNGTYESPGGGNIDRNHFVFELFV